MTKWFLAPISQQPFDDGFDSVSLGFGLVVADDAVPQDGRGNGADVLDVGAVLAVQGGVDLGADDQVLRGARPGAPREVRVDVSGGALAARARLAHEAHGVLEHVVGDGHAADELLEVGDFLAGDDRLDICHGVRGGRLDDAQLLGVGWVIDPGVEHEAVELGFGKGVGAFLFNGVLRGEHEKRRRERVMLAGHRDRAFLHRLEEGGLRFGRRPVDLVGEDDVGEERPLHEFELARLVEDFGADDVGGHQVGGELDAVEAQAEGLGDGVDEEGFGEAGHPDQQHVATGKNRRGHFLDDVLLPHDHLANLR